MIKYIGIISFVVYSLLVLILIINIKRKSAIIKFSFGIMFLLLMGLFIYYNQDMLDHIIRFLVRYIYFPSFTSYLITLFLTLIILISSVLSEKFNKKIRVVNYICSSLLIVGYIIFMILNIDISLYSQLYSGASLMCLKYSTRGFIVWMIIIAFIKSYGYFVVKGDYND